jgi:arylsulfotransferase ASST
MNRICCLLLLCVFTVYQLGAQMLPKNGSVLSYRLIGFSFPSHNKADNYTIEIAKGLFNAEDSFGPNIVAKQTGSSSRIIAEVPSFGCEYTWHIIYNSKSTVISRSPFFHFQVLSSPVVDSSVNRLRVLHSTGEHKDSYVFLDNGGVMYDMNGRAVWFLPPSFGANPQATDLKLSPKGTITFLINDVPHEINYNGDILWKAPDNGLVSGAKREMYHHEFTRLSNGHYMTMGMEEAGVLNKLPSVKNRKSFVVGADKLKGDKSDTIYRKEQFGTMIEYDQKGNFVWSWKSSAYFNDADLYYRVANDPNTSLEMHQNSFFFDEKNSKLYISFRVSSRVIEIEYPGGKLLATYGKSDDPAMAEHTSSFFYGQHGCKISRKGYLYLYNNNACDTGCLPGIVMLQGTPGDLSPKVIWEYACPTTDIAKDYEVMKSRLIFRSGGNVTEMPDYSMFVSMAQPYSEVFIVNHDKQKVWSALPEHLDQGQTKWQITPEYRASIINSRDEMERLIWGEETGK